MTADVGRGDVVASTGEHVAAGYGIHVGDRSIVSDIQSFPGYCLSCGQTAPGLLLERYPLPPGYAWCICGWRKVGGGQAEHVAWFAEDLIPAEAPEEVDA
jgi:hypothetical protein